MDIVIPLGSGSTWDNNELRYALRSIEKNCTGVGQLWIIGERPDFLINVNHIPFEDTRNKEANIMHKIMRACNEPQVSDDFFFTNDDIFINTGLDIRTLPAFRREISLVDAAKRLGSGNYAAAVHNTIKALRERFLPINHFDGHVPIIYNKQKFIDVMQLYDWNVQNGYVIKSLYCNTLRIPGEVLPDHKVNTALSHEKIYLAFKKPYVSIAEMAITDVMKWFLPLQFPKKSWFEK